MQLRAVEQGDREAARLVAVPVEARLAVAREDQVAPEDLVLLVEQARQVAVMQALLLLALAKEAEHVKEVAAHMLYPQVVQALVPQASPAVRARVSVRLVLALAQAGLPVKVPADVPR